MNGFMAWADTNIDDSKEIQRAIKPSNLLTLSRQKNIYIYANTLNKKKKKWVLLVPYGKYKCNVCVCFDIYIYSTLKLSKNIKTSKMLWQFDWSQAFEHHILFCFVCGTLVFFSSSVLHSRFQSISCLILILFSFLFSFVSSLPLHHPHTLVITITITKSEWT